MRIGVLGCGSIGRRHLKNLALLRPGPIVAYDPSTAAAALASATVGEGVVTDLDDFWAARPTGVIVAVPPAGHVPLALEAARRGCDLFIEKPLAAALDGVDELGTMVRARDLVAMVACNMRFHPGPAAVHALLAEGAVGDVLMARFHTGSYLPAWRPGSDHRRSYSASPVEGGAILDCIHELDLALWLCGPATVVAAATVPGESIEVAAEGGAEILLRHAGGAIGSVHLNFFQRDYQRGCTIVGTKGSLHWSFSDGTVRHCREDGTESVVRQPDGWRLNDMYVAELEHWLACVADRVAPCAELAAGTAALELALAARALARGEAASVHEAVPSAWMEATP